jgi:hypothetical protein
MTPAILQFCETFKMMEEELIKKYLPEAFRFLPDHLRKCNFLLKKT